jgi:hypothetical protein
MTTYKIKIQEESGRKAYIVFVNNASWPEKDFYDTAMLSRYLENQRKTGRIINAIRVFGSNGNSPEAGKLESELKQTAGFAKT